MKVLFPLYSGAYQPRSSSVFILGRAYLPVLPHSMSLWPPSTLRLISQRANLPGLDHFLVKRHGSMIIQTYT
jgi:hypothetical protein